MEIKINKDVREYTEALFFGLNIRQLICSGLAIASAVSVYIYARDVITQEYVTYLCIAVAVPFAAVGFVKYNSMPLEKVIWAIIKDCILFPRRLTCRQNNLYWVLMKGYFEKEERKGMKGNAQECEVDSEAG